MNFDYPLANSIADYVSDHFTEDKDDQLLHTINDAIDEATPDYEDDEGAKFLKEKDKVVAVIVEAVRKRLSVKEWENEDIVCRVYKSIRYSVWKCAKVCVSV